MAMGGSTGDDKIIVVGKGAIGDESWGARCLYANDKYKLVTDDVE